MSLEDIRKFIDRLNARGIPLPLVRDPKTGRGDIALTLVFLSSIWVQMGIIGKYSKYFDTIDISSAINWFTVCAGLYWARKISNPTPPMPPKTKEEIKKEQQKNVSQGSNLPPDCPD